MVAWSREAVGLVVRLHETSPDDYAHFGERRANMMGLVDASGALDFYHGGLRARDADGGEIFDHVDYTTYPERLVEEIRPWSYMKFPHIRTLGPEEGWYRVGPLARVQIADRLATPQAEAERVKFVAANGGKPAHGALLTHWARMIEMLHAAELVRDLLDDPDITGSGSDGRQGRRAAKRAIGVIEAPRGTLFHHYRVGENDLDHLLQPHRLHHQQQSGDERGGARGRRRPSLERPRDHRGPAQPRSRWRSAPMTRACPARPTRSAPCRWR